MKIGNPNPRKPLSRTERYASVILELKTGDGHPIISRERAKHMTAAEIIEEFEARTHDDHIVPRAVGGSDHVANMQPLVAKTDHAAKTKIDRREIDRTKRIVKDQAEFRRRLLAKYGEPAEAPTASPKMPSRPMPGSRASEWKKTMDGRVVRR